MKRYISDEVKKTAALLDAISKDDALLDLTEEIVHRCVQALKTGNKILLAGNGGSAADAQHLAGEFACRFAYDRPGLPALALTSDSSVMTAIANDYEYDFIFARQIQGLGNAGDVFIGLSTSGRSPNVIRALEESRRKQLISIGVTGRSGGKMRELCDLCLCIPADETAKIQEAYKVLGHIICALVEREMFPKP